MNISQTGKHSMSESVFVFLIYAVFAFMALMIVSIGAGVYGNLRDNVNNNYDIRTSLSFVATKIRQADTEGAVYVKPYVDGNALIIEEIIDNTKYETWLYHYNGTLCELFMESGITFTPESGDTILEIEKFDINSKEDGKILLSAENKKGAYGQLTLALRSAEKGGRNDQ